MKYENESEMHETKDLKIGARRAGVISGLTN
jgi:hypothetical protein